MKFMTPMRTALLSLICLVLAIGVFAESGGWRVATPPTVVATSGWFILPGREGYAVAGIALASGAVMLCIVAVAQARHRR